MKVTADTITDEQIRATKAAVHCVRLTLRNAVLAKLDDGILERLRVLSFEIAAALDERTGDV